MGKSLQMLRLPRADRQPRTLLISVGCLVVLIMALTRLAHSLLPLTVDAADLTTPAIVYDPVTNKVTIGATGGASAGSQSITIPALALALAAQGQPDLLVEQSSGAWLLKASVLIQRTAQLTVTGPAVTWLRLDSPPVKPVVLTVVQGGHLLFDGVKVTSWDSVAGTVDENIANERSYLLALEGGRMDILKSEVAYLGWSSGEPSGLSWRKRRNRTDPTTGATGRVEDSNIHHNYFGLYTYEAYGLKVLRNEVHNNISYGIDPHDDSQHFEVAYNRVHHNGNHGIIFSRLCKFNVIHHNEVHDNALHGIMLDRGTNNNVIHDNLVYNNQDGIAIFQSSDNEIRNNTVRNNRRGMRINATFDADDVYDGLSNNNYIHSNVIEESADYGIYLYARSDRNRIARNVITGSGISGIYIKSGGNQLEGNRVSEGGVGINIVGGDDLNLPPEALPVLDPPGANNIIIGSQLVANRDVGLRILGGVNNRIGLAQSNGDPAEGNLIEGNGKDGVGIGDAVTGEAATDNTLIGNTIRGNLRHGVLVTDITSQRNRISRNVIVANGQLGIKVEPGAQGGLTPPTIHTVLADGQITGTATANVTLEFYGDAGTVTQAALTPEIPLEPEGVMTPFVKLAPAADREGERFLGTATSDAAGVWQFAAPTGQNPAEVSVLAIDGAGNTSAFGGSSRGPSNAFYALITDDHGQETIQVTGVGAVVTLPEIKAGLGNANLDRLVELGNGLWRLNRNLFIGPGVTLNLSPAHGVNELQLRSQPSVGSVVGIDYSSFVYLHTYNGVLNFDNVKVYSWDAAANTYDTDAENGRAYLLAKYDAAMNIRNSDIGYLGSADGESYGISWRDINDTATPDELRTRVTGEVINSNIHHHYYGIYTYQAADMVFRNNQFHHNIRYGFDPHDFTHSVLVEGNVAYNNGAHGFIISRGCNNFVIRNNVSYNNVDPTANQAHGFMLDPGSPNSELPQSPSFNNLLEGNEAYGNEGFGLRVLGSHTNQIVNNYFYRNLNGISVDTMSTDNTIRGNQLISNTMNGLVLRETADKNIVENNLIRQNGSHGIYVRSERNLFQQNQVLQNSGDGIGIQPISSLLYLRGNQLISNTISGNQVYGVDLRNTQETLVRYNLIETNGNHGVYFTDGSTQNAVEENIIRRNQGYGVQANGPGAVQNTWSRNSITENQLGGIQNVGGANANLAPPILRDVQIGSLTGQGLTGSTVEIFADMGQQGAYFMGRTIVNNSGVFSLTVDGPWLGENLTGTTIDSFGNASIFSVSFDAPSAATPTPTNTPPPTPTRAVATATPTPPSVGPLYLPVIQR
jgi:parallel beta-helix repeat protein